MKTITKSTMCHLLYYLNWHITELRASARDAELPTHERETLNKRIKELKLIKGKTLAKLVLEGYARIQGVQVDLRIKPVTRFYSIRMNREFSFHFLEKEFEGLMNEQEKIRAYNAKEEAQVRNP